MINICNRTEYSFRLAFGHLHKVLDANPEPFVGICDRHGTWGHVAFEKECKKRGKKAILGVELAVVDDATKMEKQGQKFLRFIAFNNESLSNLYRLTTKATEHFYYFPRIDMKMINEFGKKLYILTSRPIDLALLPDVPIENIFLDLHPGTEARSIDWANKMGIPPVATSDNLYPTMDDFNAYQICIGKHSEERTTSIHILQEHEWRLNVNVDKEYQDLALNNARLLAEASTTSLPKAKLVHPEVDQTLRQMCEAGAVSRGIKLEGVYADRLTRELDLIKEKDFEDYFFLIADLVQEAKKHMLVGPARGSSCGSLVCYLLAITDIDPIPYDLLFERFIDINRKDLPDIDIDFPEDKRDMVFEYLRNKYGAECVAQLGTVSRYKAKITIGDVAKELRIPAYEVNDLKNAIIERSGGDARAAFCIMDTFTELDIGKKMLAKYPELAVAAEIEAHARHSGKHAAGIVVTADPVFNYCSVDVHTGATQVDKYDAEELNLLKIDALGLRTLTLIQDCLDQVGWSREKLLQWPLDDKLAFEVLNNKKFTGVFQFEGYALQSLAYQVKTDSFEDIVSLTALARPGPLVSGMANEWLKRRSGASPVVYEHPMLESMLKTTYGIVVYQENIMQIAREFGKMSWEDVSSLRKAMSKYLGKEFFDKYGRQFIAGAVENGFPEEKAKELWDKMNTFGSWAFNRSHAVAYGTVSYWCLVLKAYFPKEYAVACLRHAKDEEQQIKLLRELVNEGFEYKPFDPETSLENWSVQNGVIVGGLLGVKGIGPKTAKEIAKRRTEGTPLTPGQLKKLKGASTAYDNLFECKSRWGHLWEEPLAHELRAPPTYIKDITLESDGHFTIVGKLTEKNLRDKNELIEIKKRGGSVMKGQTLFLNMKVEDDTESINISIGVDKYEKLGKPIIESGKIGDWFIFRGKVKKGFRKLYVERVRKLSPETRDNSVDENSS